MPATATKLRYQFLCVTANYWGAGATVKDAKAKCRSAGGGTNMKTQRLVVRMDPEPDDIFVDDLSGPCVPNGTTCTVIESKGSAKEPGDQYVVGGANRPIGTVTTSTRDDHAEEDGDGVSVDIPLLAGRVLTHRVYMSDEAAQDWQADGNTCCWDLDSIPYREDDLRVGGTEPRV